MVNCCSPSSVQVANNCWLWCEIPQRYGVRLEVALRSFKECDFENRRYYYGSNASSAIQESVKSGSSRLADNSSILQALVAVLAVTGILFV